MLVENRFNFNIFKDALRRQQFTTRLLNHLKYCLVQEKVENHVTSWSTIRRLNLLYIACYVHMQHLMKCAFPYLSKQWTSFWAFFQWYDNCDVVLVVFGLSSCCSRNIWHSWTAPATAWLGVTGSRTPALLWQGAFAYCKNNFIKVNRQICKKYFAVDTECAWMCHCLHNCESLIRTEIFLLELQTNSV